MDPEIQRLKDISKRMWQKNLENLAAMRAEQQAEAEAARLAAEATANLPTPEATEYPIANGISIRNGSVVERPPVPVSPTVAKTAAFTAANEAARQNVRR